MFADNSENKFFDRKFVADNLRSQLCCPKCSRQYSHEYVKESAENARPFLLSCGHSLCECCTAKHGEQMDFKCAVCGCLALPSINAKESKSSYIDNYELNYHVLGETNGIDHYQRYLTEPATNSPLGEVEAETMCSECGHSAASGECKQCNAFYCKRCFETVHQHGRVLKRHLFQCFDDSAKVIRVGKDTFEMPSRLMCSVHNTPALIYCSTCRRHSCELCAKSQHGNHIVSTVGEMNHRYITEVPASISSIDAALLQIYNCQLVLKNTERQLGHFAAETLASISNHFRQLHGQLQIAELQAVEKLRESSLSPQLQLNVAIGQLNDYETLLKTLRQMLHGSVGDRFEVPQDIWLKDVIMLLNEHLEKIPSYVHVTKIASNPYHFKATKNNLMKLLDRNFVCEFVDPQLELRFTNEFDHQSLISCAGNKVKPTATDAQCFKKLNHHRIKKANSDSSSCSLTGSEGNFLRTFSAMDISQSSQVGDWFVVNALVHVRSIQSPDDFYVQCVRAAQRMREQLEAFVNSPDCQPPNTIVVGQQYIIEYHNELHRWHRALVSQKAEKRGIYHVFLPDIGHSFKAHRSNFRQLPKDLATLPYAAVHCSLKQLMPSNGGSVWDPRASAFLKQVVQNKPVRICELHALGSQHYEVDLVTTNYNMEILVRDAFLYAGLAVARDGNGGMLMMPLRTQRVSKYMPVVGHVLKVQLLHVEHPQEFYVMSHHLEKKRRILQRDLQFHMERMSLSELEPVYRGFLELACVLQVDGQWQRARIEQMLPEGYVKVRLMDNGVSQHVYWDALFVLPQKFLGQELASRCCLADVETLQAHGYAWTTAAIAAFQQLTSNRLLQMEVISVRYSVAHVALFFNNNNSNVAALLVAQGHCQSSGESSRLAKLQERQTPLVDADTRKLIEQTQAPFAEAATSQRATKRTPIEVVHVQHPGEFYVTLAHFVPAIAELSRTVQTTAAEMYRSSEPHSDWQPGDMCYVRVMAKGDLEILWHRGQIVSCAAGATFNVRLRDIGELVLNVPNNCLAPMDVGLRHIASSALCCRLHDLLPYDGHWSPAAIDFFKTVVDSYSELHVTGKGRDGDCLLVVLWGAHTEISGPFSPARTKYTNINEILYQAGIAVIHRPFHDFDSHCSQEEAEEANLQACLESVDRIATKTQPLPEKTLARLDFEHNDEMPPLVLLKNINTNATSTGCAEAPPSWLQSRKCQKSLFTALPTYVNHQCEIYLSMASDEPFVQHMRQLLLACFKPLLQQQQQPGVYVVGQPVVATYHLDKHFYRGIVKSNLSEKGVHKVYYVDYGNEEEVSPAEMLPYAPFPNLKALCWRMAIHGVRPRRKSYSLKTVDTVHQTVVMKLSSVRVVEPGGANGLPLPQCQIKVDDLDIATMMLNNEMAVRTVQPDDQELKQLNFKLFDELQQLGEIQGIADASQKNTTDQPPPAKKQFVMNSKENSRQRLDCVEDFDCKEPVKRQQKTTVNLEEDDSSDDDDDAEGFSDDYVTEEIDDEAAQHKADESQQASFMPLVVKQMRQRIQMRYKERLETAHFSPMDTSTERSYHDDVGCFKSQCLPTGVKNFPCTIDKVVSSTELQVTPQLTEFAKQEIILAQETSALIRDAAQLDPVQVEAMCLARYSPDNQWYRAIVKELHQAANEATVFYVDFQDTKMVPFTDLKVMPKQLFMFPLRSFRVKLYGIKLNRSFADTYARQALHACLCKHPTVFARVHYPLNYNDNSDDYDSDPYSSADSVKRGYKLLEVDIFENQYKTELLYKPLIDSRMFLLK